MGYLKQNQILMEEKYENLDVDQIEVAEFEFLGLEVRIRFELNSRNQILRTKNKKLGAKSKIGHGYACSNPKSGLLLHFQET